MGYGYVGAHVLRYGVAAQWEAKDLSQEIVAVSCSKYRRIVLEVLRDGEVVVVDFEQLRPEYATYQNTMSVLLLSIGNRDLATLPAVPGGKIDYIRYSDAYRVGYSVFLAQRGVNLPDNYPRDELPDLVLARPGYDTNLALLHSHHLVSVNGFFHMTDSNGEKTWVVDGGNSVRKLNLGHVGITSFMDIGKLTKEPITITSVAASNPDSPLKDGLTFTVNQATEGKSFFLVLGGYLVMPQPGVFFQVAERKFHLSLQRLPYLQRLAESMGSLDLSALNLTVSELNPSMLNIDEVFSDATILKYLALSQSFFVGVDRAEMFANTVMLRPAKIPGIYSTLQEPTLPLLVGYGRGAEYWKIDEGGCWAVTVIDNFLRRYIFDQTQKTEWVNVTDALDATRPYFLSQGAMLELGAYAS